MRVSIGRFGLEIEQGNVHDMSHSGNDITLTGLLDAQSGSNDVEFLREQLNGLVNNPFEPFYPVVFPDLPWFTGYYVVNSATVTMPAGSLAGVPYGYTVAMTKVGAFSVPTMEAALFGAPRPNDYSVSSDSPWHAVPATATGYSVKVTATPEIRHTEDGDLNMFTGGRDDTMYGSFAQFTLAPENYYDGAPKVRAGQIESVNATIFAFTGGAQTYLVPTGVNRVLLEVRGAQGAGITGGKGGRMVDYLDVSPGQTLNVYVGGAGRDRNGGYNGGGGGGLGSVGGQPSGPDGYGGGGASDVRVGGTGLANRVIVAGGGGGQGGAPVYGYAGGKGAGPSAPTAGANPDGSGGKGGTLTSGGAGGTPHGTSSSAGNPGTLGTGGHGANANVGNRFGGGGGGGGTYGGGGGAGNGDVVVGGSGGGGSGRGTGDRSFSGQLGFQAGDGLVAISPVTVGFVDVDRYTIVGGQAPNSPFGWELTNGLVRVTPTYVAGQASFQFQCWTTGGGWSPPFEWYVTDAGSSLAAALANLTAFSMLQNTPEEVVVRANYEYGTGANRMTVTFLLRRGTPIVDVSIDATFIRQWGWRAANASAATLHTSAGNGMTQTGTDADGNKWELLAPKSSTRVNTGQSGVYSNASVPRFPLGVGFVPAGFTSLNPAGDLRDQYYAAQTVTLRAVIPGT